MPRTPLPGRGAASEPDIGQAPGPLRVLQAFVNTLDIEQATDALDSPAALDDWLHSAGLADGGDLAPSGPADLEKALELREALRGVLRSHLTHQQRREPGEEGEPAPGPARRLRQAAAAMRARIEVDASGQVVLAPAGPARALTRLVLIAAGSATLGTWRRLKVCSAGDCQWAFYDRSPTRNGCWCSMQICGSRAKSRAYRSRSTASRSGHTAAPGA